MLRPSTRLRLRRVFWGDEQSTSENDSGSESSEVAGLSGATGSSSPAVLFQSCFKGACSRNEINENNLNTIEIELMRFLRAHRVDKDVQHVLQLER